MDKITTYFRGVQHETKHVKWPSRPAVISYTVVVIAISLIAAGMLGLFDVLLTEIVTSL
jgi:preprotein translocase SecE subunit